MLTKLTLHNFKRFGQAEIELGSTVVFVGPNNSGKSTALQALALWQTGLKTLRAKRDTDALPKKRFGVPINRLELTSVPVPAADLLWHRRKTQSSEQKDLRIEILVEGISAGKPWACGLEFDYTNAESLYCRPLREDGFGNTKISEAQFRSIPEEATKVQLAYLPPMSGLTASEDLHHPGTLARLIGQGQTAQILRNLCHRLAEQQPKDWTRLIEQMNERFGVRLMLPLFVAERGQIEMSYQDRDGTTLDLSSAGRGLQQMLLLLAFLKLHPRTVLLLDEPDAHLEILRQREVYTMLAEEAATQEAQILIASHSEVVLNEACELGHQVVAFVGTPHSLTRNKKAQVIKSLNQIGWDKYYAAEKTGWVLFLEDATDLEILRAWADVLQHPAKQLLDCAFVDRLGNNVPQDARNTFFGLLEAKSDLRGLLIVDRVETELQNHPAMKECMWQRREIENYLCREDILLRYAKGTPGDDLFSPMEAEKRVEIMRGCIQELVKAKRVVDDAFDPWSPNIKATDEFLDPLFKNFAKALGSRLELRKRDYHMLAALMTSDEIDPEVSRMLDLVEMVSKQKN